jgi:hypothetical protein
MTVFSYDKRKIPRPGVGIPRHECFDAYKKRMGKRSMRMKDLEREIYTDKIEIESVLTFLTGTKSI